VSIGHAWEPDMFEGPHALTTPIRTTDPSDYRKASIMSSTAWFVPAIGPSTTEGRAIVRSYITEAAEDHRHDPWGSALSALGVLCDALQWVDYADSISEDIYRPSPMQDPWGEWIVADEFEDAWRLTDDMREGRVTVADILAGVAYLDRFADVAKAAGRDY
jgi:hypothetical protein